VPKVVGKPELMGPSLALVDMIKMVLVFVVIS